MVKLKQALKAAAEEQDKVKVFVVLEGILEYAIAEGDGDLISKTLDTIYIMKGEN